MSKFDEDYFPLYRCKKTGKLFENPKRPEDEGFERLEESPDSEKKTKDKKGK